VLHLITAGDVETRLQRLPICIFDSWDVAPGSANDTRALGARQIWTHIN